MIKLSKQIIRKSRRNGTTPFLLLNLNQVTANFNRLKKALPSASIHYSIKSNSDDKLICHLHKLGSRFDVASWAEIQFTHKCLVPPAHLVFSSPIKPVVEIKNAYQYGVRQFAFDSYSELDKLRSVAPQSQVILRILVESESSQCPMFKKFGVYIDEAAAYLQAAIKNKLKPIGLTFHVGSQCLSPDTWINALFRINKVWEEALKQGIQLQLINLGGGLPASYDQKTPPINHFARVIKQELNRNFSGLKNIYIEPGRYMTDQAGIMVATVIGLANRGNAEWIYLDVGGFNGLFEIFENFKYNLHTEHPRRKKTTYAVGGPTCDGMDIIRKEILLPKVKLGERVYIMNAGAYSTSIQQYNGIPWPKTIVV